jgi:peptidoglycan/LPS O-acetylase OafA/YrhL
MACDTTENTLVPDESTSRVPSELTAPAPWPSEPDASPGRPIANPRAEPRSFLVHVHRFRAIAILIIVAGHAVAVFQWRGHVPLATFLLDLFENGTVLFVFISGYLFQYLEHPERFRYGPFLGKKLLHVVLPYLVVSTPAVVHALLRYKLTSSYPQLKGTSLGYQALWLYVKGGAHLNYPLWFIPMMTLYYVAAPVFIGLACRPRWQRIVFILVPLSLLAHRPSYPNLDTLQLALYYLLAYVAGMYVCQRRAMLEPWLSRRCGWISAVFAVLMLGHWWLSPYHGNYGGRHLFSFERGLIDWLFLQQLVLALVLLGLMDRVRSYALTPLNALATLSFTIFFVHMYALHAVRVVSRAAPLEGDLWRWLAVCIGTVAVSGAGAALGRRVLGSRSRLLIGA